MKGCIKLNEWEKPRTMKNELLEKIKQEVAQENEFTSYQAMSNHLKEKRYLLEQINDEIAHRYAQAYAKKKLEEVIDYIENNAEIAIPVEDLMNKDGTHMSKKEYGLVLLKHLCIELRGEFSRIKKPRTMKRYKPKNQTYATAFKVLLSVNHHLVIEFTEGTRWHKVAFHHGVMHWFEEVDNMTPNQAAKQLEAYNLWRRDNEGIHPMPDPKESGKAIDKAIEILKKI